MADLLRGGGDDDLWQWLRTLCISKRTLWRWLFGISLVWTTLLYTLNSPLTRFTSESNAIPTDPGPESKVILYWTKYYNDAFLPGLRIYHEAVRGIQNCPVNNCVITSNHFMLNQSSAVIFHIRDILGGSLPDYRDPEQYYVYHSLESPPHTMMSLSSFSHGFFNLTFTYRLDSDIVADSYFQHYKPPMWSNWSSFDKAWALKTKLAVAFLSNCWTSSLREFYLEELREYMPVDMYGTCGTLQCSRSSVEEEAKCNGVVSTYKFYLAFENSVCRDYVTEKIHRAYEQNTIPVVYGGANYTALFPPNSFINIWDFPNAKDLADRLLFLSINSTAYQEYFQWKLKPVYGSLPPAIHQNQISWCKLCTLLNEPQRKNIIMWNLEEWWNKLAHCMEPITTMLPEGKVRWAKDPISGRALLRGI